MTLHEAIQTVLKENNRPLTGKVITSIINSQGYYYRSDREPIEGRQILSRVKNYPSIFQNINGQIILIEDSNWKNLLTSYWYLVNTLKGIYIVADVQFIVAVLLFYKRIVDINHRPGRRYPLDFNKDLKSSFDKIIDGGNTWVQGLKTLENYYIAPQGVFEECSRLLLKLDNNKKIEI